MGAGKANFRLGLPPSLPPSLHNHLRQLQNMQLSSALQGREGAADKVREGETEGRKKQSDIMDAPFSSALLTFAARRSLNDQT